MTRTTMLFTYVLFILLYTSGCAALPVAPLVDGEVMNLFQGTARWLTTSGDVLIHIYYNPVTRVVVHARPLVDGWAFACEQAECDDIVAAYLVNINTWNAVKAWMVENGYVLVAGAKPPPTPMPTILVIPAALLERKTSEAMWACALGFGVIDESGTCVGSNPILTSGAFAEVSDFTELNP